MTEFFSNYGLWIVLAGIFFAMHMFGMGCCGGHGGHQHGDKQQGGTGDESGEPGGHSAGASTAASRTVRPHAHGCH